MAVVFSTLDGVLAPVNERTRRRFLRFSLAGLAAVLAGCGFPGGEGEEEGGEEGGEGGEEGGEDDRSAPALGPDEY